MRFSILLIITTFIIFFNKSSAQEIASKGDGENNYTGTYKLITRSTSVNGYIEIEEIAPHKVKFFLFVVRYGDIAETDGVFEIENNKGVFHNRKHGAKNCTLAFLFNKDSLSLNQDGQNWQCAFGLNAYVRGKYKKVSSEKPLFKRLNWEDHEKKNDSVYKKEVGVLFEKTQFFINTFNDHPVTIANKTLNKKRNVSSYSLNRISDYNTFLQEVFRNKKYIRTASDILSVKALMPDTINQMKFDTTILPSISKRWIEIIKTDSGYIIPDWRGITSLEILQNAIIFNQGGCIDADIIRSVQKTRDGIYKIYPKYLNKDSLNCFYIEVIDPRKSIAKISVRYMSCNFRAESYQYTMIPIKNLLQFPLRTQRNRDEKNTTLYLKTQQSAAYIRTSASNNRSPIMDIMMYKSVLKRSFLDSVRQSENKAELIKEASFLSKSKIPSTMRDLQRNADFQSFYKEWVCVHKEDAKYVLFGKSFNPNIQITNNQIIINTTSNTYAHFIKSIHKSYSGEYVLTTFFPSADSLNVFIFKTIDPKRGLTEVHFKLQTATGIKSYSWMMTPIKNILKFPFGN